MDSLHPVVSFCVLNPSEDKAKSKVFVSSSFEPILPCSVVKHIRASHLILPSHYGLMAGGEDAGEVNPFATPGIPHIYYHQRKSFECAFEAVPLLAQIVPAFCRAVSNP